ncbi:hypothetical protein JK358_12585 [Nocardia sp. 2]|uniref:Secreted protein n=1 Tax=Nocardia acididurans TaxID=2802282 RepID=A0ABS1M3S6_9NOCA|nr:hypothetical protein [Nocardia acididurans]MBL1075230.1 hypothetical protein [Nocardia acididurans]
MAAGVVAAAGTSSAAPQDCRIDRTWDSATFTCPDDGTWYSGNVRCLGWYLPDGPWQAPIFTTGYYLTPWGNTVSCNGPGLAQKGILLDAWAGVVGR